MLNWVGLKRVQMDPVTGSSVGVFSDMVAPLGIEPRSPFGAADFKSAVFASFTTGPHKPV